MTNHERAIIYAAFKYLETLQKQEELPPGFNKDVSNEEITIRIGNDTTVWREAGANNSGLIDKKASTDLNGWAVIALFYQRLKKFQQGDYLWNVMVTVLNETVNTPKMLKEELIHNDPEFKGVIEKLKASLEVTRKDRTPRKVQAKEKATITFHKKQERVAA